MRHTTRFGWLCLVLAISSIARTQQHEARQSDVDAWIRALQSDDAGARRAAIQSLARAGKPALPALRSTLRSRSPRTQRAAASALVRIGEPALPFVLDAVLDANSIDTATWILRRIGEPAVPALIAEVAKNGDRGRAILIRTLGRLGRAALPAVPFLIQKLDVKQDQAAAALALGDLAPDLDSQRKLVVERLLELARVWTRKTDRSWTESRATFELCVRAVRSNLTFNRGSALATALGKLHPQSVAPLREILRAGREDARLIAALALGSMGRIARPAVEHLLQNLDDPNLDPRIAVYMIWAVGHIRSNVLDAGERLRALARHRVPLLRFCAVHALLEISDDPEQVGKFLADEIRGTNYRGQGLESVEELLQWNVLRFTAEEQRPRAQRTKRYNEIVPPEQFVITPEPLVAVLIDVLSTPVRDHRVSAARILGAIGEPAAAAAGALEKIVARANARERAMALAALIRIDPGRITAEILSDGDRVAWTSETFHALRSLGSRVSRSIPILEAAIASRHAQTRRYALILLEDRRGAEPTESILLDALASRYADVRVRALHAFSGDRRASAVARLRRLLASDSPEVGEFAASALLGMHAVDELFAAMQSRDARVRARAVGGLGGCRVVPESAPRLVARALADPAALVRAAAVAVLDKQPELVAKVQPGLTKLLADEHVALRIAACGLVAADARGAIAKLLSDQDPEVATAAARRCLVLDAAPAVKAKAALLVIADKRTNDWRNAARLLAATDTPPVAELRALLANADPELAGRAATAIGQLGRRAAVLVPDLIRLLQHRDPTLRRVAVQALGSLGRAAPSAAPALEHCLDDSDRGVRVTAAISLGRLGKAAAAALPALRKKAASDDPQLAFHAQTAVKRITDDKAP